MKTLSSAGGEPISIKKISFLKSIFVFEHFYKSYILIFMLMICLFVLLFFNHIDQICNERLFLNSTLISILTLFIITIITAMIADYSWISAFALWWFLNSYFVNILLFLMNCFCNLQCFMSLFILWCWNWRFAAL